MPSRETVERFVKSVESNQPIETITAFHTDDATMQENLEPPRVGKTTLLEAQRAMSERTKQISARCVRPFLIEGDSVVIHWVFDFQRKDGSPMRVEELALQTWRGEHVASEQFFYDPAQFK